MKITCPSCQSKYTIADEKVQGRSSVKVKCRKCGETIHVSADGAAVAQPAQSEAQAPAEGASAAFSVLIAEGDQRDMTLPEIVGAYNSGLVTADTFVWGDGQPDWLPISQVPAIVDALNAASEAVDRQAAAPRQAAEPPVAAPAASAVAAQAAKPTPATEPAALPAAPPTASALSSAAAIRDDRRSPGVDLFAAPPSTGHEEDIATSAPQLGSVVAPQKPTGVRDEASVLFSLSALTSAPVAPAASPRTASAKGDDSGLIDLKALAAQQQPAAAAGPAVGGVPILDAAPILGAPLVDPSAFGAAGEKKKDSSKLPLILGLLIALIGVLAAVVIVVVTRKPAIPAAAASAAVTSTAASAPTAVASTPPVDSSGAAPPSTGAPSATAKVGGGRPVGKGGSAGGTKGGKTGATTTGGTEAPPTGGGSPSKPPPPRSKCGCAPNDLACNMACAAK